MDSMPDDILRNILARLPSNKPLSRCRCVSPHWNRVISDLCFTINSKSQRKFFVTSHKNSRPTQKIIGTFSGIVIYIRMDSNVKSNTKGRKLRTILYNPFTHAFKRLPDPINSNIDDDYDDSSFVYGIAYGKTVLDRDLKMVRLYRASNNSSKNYYLNTCDVFCFRTSSWSTSKVVTQYSKNDFDDNVGTFVNGYLYWIASYRMKIMALNVNEMVFSEIQLPNQGCFTETRLGTFHGNLCMITDTSNFVESGYDIWVMKGVENLWSKEISFPCYGTVNDDLYEFRVVNIMDDGRIMIVDSLNRVIVYDISKCSFELHNTSLSVTDFATVHGIEYVETLVAPSDLCRGY
ncbi:putative F-box protein At3g16210 [Rutidosis leptorrhynchoides]|uniref:putative F-box protein At3g16210 n=1 Tax=Rutidosis leptorrhynchoides TaxID=125765 RepID=UPI003A99566C